MSAKGTILIVEDSVSIRDFLFKQLNEYGYTVQGAVDRGEDALLVLSAKKPDIILMDINLAGKLDGFQTARQILETFGLSVVFMTTEVSDAHLNTAKKYAPLGYLSKPFTASQLKVTIEMAMAKRTVDYELKNQYKLLLDSEERFRGFFESAKVAFFIVNNDQIVDCNKYACQLMEYPYKQDIKSRFVAEVLGSQLDAHRRELRSEQQEHYEIQLSKAKGSKFWARVDCMRSNHNKSLFYLAVSDISPEVEARNNLQSSFSRLRNILDTVQAGIMLIDVDTKKIVEINKMGMKMLEYEDESLVVGQIYSAFFDDDSKHSSNLMHKQGQISYSQQHTLKALSGNIPILKNVALIDIQGKQYYLESFVNFSEQLKMRLKLEEQSNRIQKQHNLAVRQINQIAEQNKKITDSIIYANKIQMAILPPDDILNRILPSHFILYKPKDIVSGDFYWISQDDRNVYIAIADCTGHGVPGAFMSMLGMAFLNEIVSKVRKAKANLILHQLRHKVIKTLRQEGDNDINQDGMDMALCIFNRENFRLQYAGANSPLVIVRNKKLVTLKPDKMPIGSFYAEPKPFTNHSLKMQAGDMIYMFSDGYVDQFGGPKEKKFLSRRLRSLLVQISALNTAQQKDTLDDTFLEWKGNLEQVDDVLFFGMRIEDYSNYKAGTIQ